MTPKVQDPLEAGPELPGILVNPEWLGEHVGHPRVRIVDLRDREAYAGGHIPGAVQLDLEDLGENRDGCDNVVLGPAEFGRLMARLGISNGDTVVAYDDHWGLPSARLVWALQLYGERAVSVLNGGWDRWQEERRPVTLGSATDEPGTDESLTEGSATQGSWPDGPRSDRAASEPTDGFEAHPTPEVAADYEWISGGVARGDLVLLDTRSAAEFAQGHLPGAISWDWFNAVPAGSWECSREPDMIRSELAAVGVHPSDEVVTYCRSGMRAAHTYVVLRNAGFPRIRLYDGSWQEWAMKGTPPHPREG
ncbi:MAG: sulfurtransferase [Gemmatimonadetes bacterium]|nr:sulfurtransferase [Gemmatimonadota bacterium]